MGEPGASTEADTDPLLTTGKIAVMFRVCRKTITRWIDRGLLECEPRVPGGNRRCRKSKVDEFMDGLSEAPAR